jgi:hypothetical protein
VGLTWDESTQRCERQSFFDWLFKSPQPKGASLGFMADDYYYDDWGSGGYYDPFGYEYGTGDYMGGGGGYDDGYYWEGDDGSWYYEDPDGNYYGGDGSGYKYGGDSSGGYYDNSGDGYGSTWADDFGTWEDYGDGSYGLYDGDGNYYYYGADGEVQTIYADGSQDYVYSDGTYEAFNSDGSYESVTPGGDYTYCYGDECYTEDPAGNWTFNDQYGRTYSGDANGNWCSSSGECGGSWAEASSRADLAKQKGQQTKYTASQGGGSGASSGGPKPQQQQQQAQQKGAVQPAQVRPPQTIQPTPRPIGPTGTTSPLPASQQGTSPWVWIALAGIGIFALSKR